MQSYESVYASLSFKGKARVLALAYARKTSRGWTKMSVASAGVLGVVAYFAVVGSLSWGAQEAGWTAMCGAYACLSDHPLMAVWIEKTVLGVIAFGMGVFITAVVWNAVLKKTWIRRLAVVAAIAAGVAGGVGGADAMGDLAVVKKRESAMIEAFDKDARSGAAGANEWAALAPVFDKESMQMGMFREIAEKKGTAAAFAQAMAEWRRVHLEQGFFEGVKVFLLCMFAASALLTMAEKICVKACLFGFLRAISVYSANARASTMRLVAYWVSLRGARSMVVGCLSYARRALGWARSLPTKFTAGWAAAGRGLVGGALEESDVLARVERQELEKVAGLGKPEPKSSTRL